MPAPENERAAAGKAALRGRTGKDSVAGQSAFRDAPFSFVRWNYEMPASGERRVPRAPGALETAAVVNDGALELSRGGESPPFVESYSV
jgi:hypothetical protein